MKRRAPVLFVVLVLLQVLFLGGMAASYYAVDAVGKEIRLKTAPVDPRDLFYGDYVRLSYEISALPWSVWKGGERPEEGQTVYVILHKDGAYDSAVAVYPAKPQTKDGETVLQARVRGSGDSEHLNLLYGFERYYVEENTGRELEEHSGQAIVTVKVSSWGQSKITGLVFEQ